MYNAGLRSLGRWLYVCNSDDDEVLGTSGLCGLVGSRQQVAGASYEDPHTGEVAVPVRRWDMAKSVWTAEESPYAVFPRSHLPLSISDGKIDLDAIPPMPRSMTAHSVGVLAEPIESIAPAAVAAVLPHPRRRKFTSAHVATTARRRSFRRPAEDFLCAPRLCVPCMARDPV
mmetsp:Transcript_56253/g.163012  ORF Transcript_56253/g.163012 Transcript_56253/m.163012 type:complete len:172 (+) Transcript_56253:400-915(+)